MSNQEIVFAHGDRQSAERMKDSNEMVDILNSLLADLEVSRVSEPQHLVIWPGVTQTGRAKEIDRPTERERERERACN